jgi:hypothetical protein
MIYLYIYVILDELGYLHDLGNLQELLNLTSKCLDAHSTSGL